MTYIRRRTTDDTRAKAVTKSEVATATEDLQLEVDVHEAMDVDEGLYEEMGA